MIIITDSINHLFKIIVLSTLAISCLGCSSNRPESTIEIDQSGEIFPWTNTDWNNDPTNFQFVIVTDRTGGERPGVFEQGVKKVNLLQPEFVISVGDLIDGYTEDVNEIENQWEEFDEYVSLLDMPFFYIPGNHDITNQVMEDIWKQRLGKSYYHFIYRNVLFLCLNSEEGLDAHRSSFFSKDQREYIQNTLIKYSEVRWTLVFLHKPVWLAAESSVSNDELEEVERSGWQEIETILQGRKHTVFAGHIHRYTHRQKNDSDYITLATTGGSSGLRGPIFGQFDHVMWVTMTDEGPVMANLMLDGIWDKDLDQADIERYLSMSLQKKAVTTNSRLLKERDLTSQPITLRLYNVHDIPMEVIVEFTNKEYVIFSDVRVEKIVPPNSIEKVTIMMQVDEETERRYNAESEEEKWSKLWEEFGGFPASWEVTYDFEEYGKMVVEGTTYLF